MVLHGLSRSGRSHPELLRFARALSSTGARVLVPEIREWTELSFAPERAQELLRAAIERLHDDDLTAPGGVVVVGFSFGAPQALVAASDPEVATRLRGVVGWGGFADLERTFRFAFGGKHEWRGRVYRQDPDPYVRWVIGNNCLPLSRGLDREGKVAAALRVLATAAGDREIRREDGSAAALERELAATLEGEDRELFDVFASELGGPPDPDRSRAVIDELIPLARREIPLLDPLPSISRIEVPVRLLHPRSDRLIPFTETLRMGEALEEKVDDLELRVTGRFSHAGGDAGGGPVTRAWENLRFLGALRSVFDLS